MYLKLQIYKNPALTYDGVKEEIDDLEFNENKEKAVIVGLNVTAKLLDIASTEETLDELRALVETAGGEIVASCLQTRQLPDSALFIGEGKADEIARLASEFEADIIVFDNELSPVQMKNLEKKFNLPVLDRTGIILDIFASRARSAEGKLQVELAQYKYLLPRLIGQGINMSRQAASGGTSPIGTRGPGETKLETDRRHIRRRISKLEKDIDEIGRVRKQQSKSREKTRIKSVALAGYTNSGKTTLLNALTDSDLMARNRLFDTLDTTTRNLELKNKSTALLSDTVGFIENLPHQLVDAFRATLDELKNADLVLHVVDVSNLHFAEQIAVTDKLADELCTPGTPKIYVYNKMDLCDDLQDINMIKPGVFVSAHTGENLPTLKDMIYDKLFGDRVPFSVKIPHREARVMQMLYDEAEIEDVSYDEDGTLVRGRCDEALLGRIGKYIHDS